MTGLQAMEDLIKQIGLRRSRSNDHATLRRLEEVLDVLEGVETWFRREPIGPRTERVRVVLDELRWTSAETLVAASSEQLDAGLLQLIHALLEWPQAHDVEGSSTNPAEDNAARSSR